MHSEFALALPLKKTTYFVWDYEDETIEDAKPFEEYDEQDAAEAWAECFDRDDYELTSGGSLVVVVAPASSPDDQLKFRVRAEQSTDYYADEVE